MVTSPDVGFGYTSIAVIIAGCIPALSLAVLSLTGVNLSATQSHGDGKCTVTFWKHLLPSAFVVITSTVPLSGGGRVNVVNVSVAEHGTVLIVPENGSIGPIVVPIV